MSNNSARDCENTYKSIHTFLHTHHPLWTVTTFTKNNYNRGDVCKDYSFEKQMPYSANEMNGKNRMALWRANQSMWLQQRNMIGRDVRTSQDGGHGTSREESMAWLRHLLTSSSLLRYWLATSPRGELKISF